MKEYAFFIDESGQANPKNTFSPVYVLSACMVKQDYREKLKVKADQIKFKYWDRTDIVFHSREIGRREGDFQILKDKNIRNQFEKDLFKFLHQAKLQLFFVLVDHKKAKKQNWNDKKVYKETSHIMVKNFILALLAKNCKGRLVIESATSEKDFNFHRAAGFFLSHGLDTPKVFYDEVQNALTEISFVTKKNFDIEEQIADLLAYGAKLKFLKKSKRKMTNYEKNILKVMKGKLFRMHPNTGRKKRKLYSKIKSFEILP